MAVEALCPICGATFSLKDEMNGKKVRCTKCEQVFTVGGEAKAKEREEKQAVQSKSSAKKSRADDDDEDVRPPKRAAARRGDDDDDEEPRPRSKKKRKDDDEDEDDGKSKKLSSQVQRKGTRSDSKDTGIPGKTFAIAAGALVALVVVCGGGGYLAYNLIWGEKEPDKTAANNPNNNKNNNGPPKEPEKKIENVNDALAWLKGNNTNERRAALEWLTRAPVDPGRQAEVARALNPTLTDPDGSIVDNGLKAMDHWCSADNVPALVAVVNDERYPHRHRAMAILGKLKDKRGADAVAARLVNGGDRKAAGDALIAMGPVAKSATEQFTTHPDQGVRREAERVLKGLGADTSGLGLAQALADLESPDGRRRSDAAQTLARMPVDPAQQSKVTKALEAAVEKDTDRGAEEQAIRALGVWGTKESATVLVRVVEGPGQPNNCKNAAIDVLVKLKDERVVKSLATRLRDRFQRGNASKQLIALGPERGTAIEAEILSELDGTDRGLKVECAKILGAVGTKASITKLEETATKAMAAKPAQRDVAQSCNDAVAAIKAR